MNANSFSCTCMRGFNGNICENMDGMHMNLNYFLIIILKFLIYFLEEQVNEETTTVPIETTTTTPIPISGDVKKIPKKT